MGSLISTRDASACSVSYLDAIVQGLAPDGGLLVPEEYPTITRQELAFLQGQDYQRIAAEVKQKFVGNEIRRADMGCFVNDAYAQENFGEGPTVPVRVLEDNLYIMNLSRGPTAAFKDIALQLLGRELNYTLQRRDEHVVMLGATSGDTGSAAEAAVKGCDSITLFMLSPQQGMSPFQKAQMGALSGENIYNVAIDGTFDDCQDLVKELKRDPEFANLGAVNSINWGRISSQVPYFVAGYLQVAETIGEQVDFVIPTGNFGNILSGYIAKKMGVPIGNLIAATNENDVVARLFNTGCYKSGTAIRTSSPSMDITKASNFERLLFDLVNRDVEKVRTFMDAFAREGQVRLDHVGINHNVFQENRLYARSTTHENRLNAIRYAHSHGRIIDPHTAAGVAVAMNYSAFSDVPTIVLETALPVKFEGTINEALSFIPEREERFQDLERHVPEGAFYRMSPNAGHLKQYIRDNAQRR